MNILPPHPRVFSKEFHALVVQSRHFPAPVVEVNNGFLKERFGLADYSLHLVEAITAWHTLVFTAYVYIQAQRVLPLLAQLYRRADFGETSFAYTG